MSKTEDARELPLAVADGSADAVMSVMRGHVPISLLVDIAQPDGPSSAEISELEGGNADWLRSP